MAPSSLGGTGHSFCTLRLPELLVGVRGKCSWPPRFLDFLSVLPVFHQRPKFWGTREFCELHESRGSMGVGDSYPLHP